MQSQLTGTKVAKELREQMRVRTGIIHEIRASFTFHELCKEGAFYGSIQSKTDGLSLPLEGRRYS